MSKIKPSPEPQAPLDHDLNETRYKNLVVDARSFLLKEGGSYFRNCVFPTKDLLAVCSQTGCTYLFFSHTICKIGGFRYSSLMVCGANDDAFYWKEGRELFFSVAVNQKFDYSNIQSFDQNSTLKWIPEPQNPKRKWEAIPDSNFLNWLQQFSPKAKTIEGNLNPRKAFFGVFYNIEKLKKLGGLLLNNGEDYPGLAFFPVTLDTIDTTPGARHPVIPAVTYALIPVDSDNKLHFPKSFPNTITISDESWPRKWPRSEDKIMKEEYTVDFI